MGRGPESCTCHISFASLQLPWPSTPPSALSLCLVQKILPSSSRPLNPCSSHDGSLARLNPLIGSRRERARRSTGTGHAYRRPARPALQAGSFVAQNRKRRVEGSVPVRLCLSLACERELRADRLPFWIDVLDRPGGQVPTPKDEWLAALKSVVDAGLIPNIPVATLNAGWCVFSFAVSEERGRRLTLLPGACQRQAFVP